jgi:hypothetical protein
VSTDDVDLLERSAELLHYVVDAVLRQPNCTEPLSVTISTTLQEAFCEPHFLACQRMPQFLANNRLESLKVRYLGQNVSGYQDCVGKLLVLSAAPTSVQFTSLRRLLLAGKSFHHGLSLNLIDDLGKSLYFPTVPSLEVLILESVQLGEDTVEYLR